MKFTEILYPLIIKVFRDEPYRLNTVENDNLFVTVVGNGWKTTMKLKIEYVYNYDKEIYQNLRKAFDSGDNERLKQEWQKAKPLVST
jgi:hypothetical protein